MIPENLDNTGITKTSYLWPLILYHVIVNNQLFSKIFLMEMKGAAGLSFWLRRMILCPTKNSIFQAKTAVHTVRKTMYIYTRVTYDLASES